MSASLTLLLLVYGPPQPPGQGPSPADDVVVEALRKASAERGHLKGERLLEHYVRHAARTASSLPKETAVRAFLSGMGRAVTEKGFGSPTMRGRADLAKHFFISAVLAYQSGPERAEAIGIAKEQADMRFGSGFSFSDVLADLAGIRFQQRLKRGELSLKSLAAGFSVADHLPDRKVLRLEDGLTAEQFKAKYGSLKDPRLTAEIRRIRAALGAEAQNGASHERKQSDRP